jgi:hypothetical protein
VSANRVIWLKAKTAMHWLVKQICDEISESALHSIFPGERDYWFVKSFEWICIVIRLLV